jgi:diacylglycerol kinase (ATP)
VRERNEFSAVRRAKSFTHAGRGVWVFIRTTHNAWIHVAILALVVLLGFYVGLGRTEWLFVVLAAGLVLTAEAFNTALEVTLDLMSPDYHPAARDAKDVAAGAVLIAAIAAAAIGLLIFVPHLLS